MHIQRVKSRTDPTALADLSGLRERGTATATVIQHSLLSWPVRYTFKTNNCPLYIPPHRQNNRKPPMSIIAPNTLLYLVYCTVCFKLTGCTKVTLLRYNTAIYTFTTHNVPVCMVYNYNKGHAYRRVLDFLLLHCQGGSV